MTFVIEKISEEGKKHLLQILQDVKLNEKLKKVLSERDFNEDELDHIPDFVDMMKCLEEHPDRARTFKGLDLFSEGWYEKNLTKFLKARLSKPKPSSSSSIPDPVIGIIMETGFGVKHSRIEDVHKDHKNAMASENFAGIMLEAYIGEKTKEHGLIHCSGDIVKAVDFIKKEGSDWLMLQVKNRNTTENSSSDKIRNGTVIQKWCRLKSSKPNWHNFPGGERYGLSEEDFQNYTRNYLNSINCPPAKAECI